MPSKSNKQKKFMQAVAHNPKFAKKVGVPVSVGKEFSEADKKNTKKKFGKGSTRAKVNNPNTRHGKLDMPYKSLKRYTGMVEGGDVKKANKGIRKMQDGGAAAMPDTAKMAAPVNGGGRAFNTPTLPSQANPRAAEALSARGSAPAIPPAPSDMMAARGNMGRGMDMRRVPTLPTQASQRARDMMARRMPITTPGGPAPLVPEVMPPAAAAAPGFNKGGRIKKMAGGGSPKEPNPRKGGALYNLGTNQNPTMRAGGRGMNKGGAAKVRKYAAGGSVKGSSRGDGCCMKGKTKGRMC